jgi:thiol-disulfide isomerase/thioredoxin
MLESARSLPPQRCGEQALRAPVDTIAAPLFPTSLPWVNVAGPQATIQRGRPLLVEFWDFCRPNSLRTLPYVTAWHERYRRDGLRVVGVHCPGFDISRDEGAVRTAVARLGIAYPVLIDSGLELWREYENEGWPARYLFDGRARLFEYHFGEGAYAETELAIQELLGVAREPLAPLRAEDAPGARLAPQTPDQPGAYCGPYEAGGVWAVLDGAGGVRVNGADATGGAELVVTHPGAYQLLEHERHTAGVLSLELEAGVSCLATCFTPGVA